MDVLYVPLDIISIIMLVFPVVLQVGTDFQLLGDPIFVTGVLNIVFNVRMLQPVFRVITLGLYG